MTLNLIPKSRLVIPRDTVSSQGLLHLCLQNKAKNCHSLLYWELLICLMCWALFTVSHIPSLSSRLAASWFLVFIPGSFSVKCLSSIPVGFLGFSRHLVHNVSRIITVYGKFTLSSRFEMKTTQLCYITLLTHFMHQVSSCFNKYVGLDCLQQCFVNDKK